MRFVDHDPAQKTLRFSEDRLILTPDRHIFEHRGVGDKDWRRVAAKRCPIADLLGCSCFVGIAVAFAFVEHQPVEQREADIAAERRGPPLKPLLLAGDEGIERIEHQRPHAAQPSATSAHGGLDLTRQIIEYRHEETFGFA